MFNCYTNTTQAVKKLLFAHVVDGNHKKENKRGKCFVHITLHVHITYKLHKTMPPTIIFIQQDRLVIGGHVLHKQLNKDHP